MKIRQNWTVYKNGYQVGRTSAVSEEEAINNVRYHVDGQMASQYKNGNWEAYPDESHEIRRQVENMENDIKAVWKKIPEGVETSIKVTSPMCRYDPMTEYEPDMIAEGELNGQKVIVGFVEWVSGPRDVFREFIPTYYREDVRRDQPKEESAPENISIFDILGGTDGQ